MHRPISLGCKFQQLPFLASAIGLQQEPSYYLPRLYIFIQHSVRFQLNSLWRTLIVRKLHVSTVFETPKRVYDLD